MGNAPCGLIKYTELKMHSKMLKNSYLQTEVTGKFKKPYKIRLMTCTLHNKVAHFTTRFHTYWDLQERTQNESGNYCKLPKICSPFYMLL